MSSWPILSLVTFLPLVGALFCLVVSGPKEAVDRNCRSAALITSLVTFVISLVLWARFDPTKASFYANPAVYALVAGGGAGFLLLTAALSRGSVTTAVAGMVIGETVGPALVGVAWLGDRTRDGLGWMVVAGFVIAVAAALALSRFGEAPSPAES